MENKEELVSEKYAYQIEQFVGGNWWMILETSDYTTEEEVKEKYESLKKNRNGSYRLLKWSKIIKYEVIDGMGF